MRYVSDGGVAAFALFQFLAGASAACPDSVCYTYDALGRLTQADYADGRLIEYTYDPAGNRVAVERTGVTNAAQDPVAVDDTVTGKETYAHTFDPRTNDSDPDTDPLTITARTNGTRGTGAIVSAGTQPCLRSAGAACARA